MTERHSEILVIGGGVIGLSIAWHLSRSSHSITVMDSSEPGQASQAAAGMLAPLAEASAPGPFLDLALASLNRYTEFVEGIRDASGLNLQICGPGMLRVARTSDEEAALDRALEWQMSLGLPLDRLSGEEVRRLEPAAAQSIIAAIRSPQERHLEPRLLIAALSAACRRRGVQQISGKVTALEPETERIVAIRTDTARFTCKTLVLAGGAWSDLLGQWLGVDIPVKPLRGQILALGPSHNPILQHTLYTHGAYLVPRRDGRIIAGATEESVGLDTSTTAHGIAALRTGAESLVPILTDQPLQSAWTGLRPLSADALPLMGRVPGWGNVHLATGHGRNGILLAPITGSLMANSILHDALPPDAFNPARFGGAL